MKKDLYKPLIVGIDIDVNTYANEVCVNWFLCKNPCDSKKPDDSRPKRKPRNFLCLDKICK
jgi:hypothetical protein